MSTTELSDLFEFHVTPMDPTLFKDELQRTLDAAVAEAAQDTADVKSASAEIQDTAADAGESVVLLHVVLAKGVAGTAARLFVDTRLTSQLEKRHVAVSQVTQRNTSGDN